jgi:hypothetical protein
LFKPLDQMRCDVTYLSKGERLVSLVHVRQNFFIYTQTHLGLRSDLKGFL